MTLIKLTRSFVSVVAFALPNVALANTTDPFDSAQADAVNHVMNELVCGRDAIEEHEIKYNQTQQVIEDRALMIGCLLREADAGVNNSDNLRIAVRALQEDLAAYAANHDMELIDSVDENGNYDGIIGAWTTEDLIDVAMAMNIDTVFRVNAFDPLSVEFADMARFRQELARFNPSAVEAAQLWAMELEFLEGSNSTPAYRDLPLCEETLGWGVNDIPCDQRASFQEPINIHVTQVTFNL